MNIEKIRMLIDVLRNVEDSNGEDRFNFENCFNIEFYGFIDGNPSCIAGWTVYLFTDYFDGMGIWAEEAAKILDISDKMAEELFFPYSEKTICVRHAIMVLENLIITGKVDWSTILKDE